MNKFRRFGASLEDLVDNSFKAIDEGAYEPKHSTSTHVVISLRNAIHSCPHAPLITEVKFSSPSQGELRKITPPADIAKQMAGLGVIGISILTQPYLFDGSIEYFLAIRKAVTSIPLLMKDIIVSTVQIDAGKQVGADCILLIKSVFDRDLAEDSMEKLAEYAKKRDLQVIAEVHTEKEFVEVIKAKYDLVGINNRNLDNLQVDITNTEKLLKRQEKGTSTIISESGISMPAEIRYLKSVGADAFLVGTSIMQARDIPDKINKLYSAL
jgi:indole-3-glycerol phosphate synthase